MVSLSEHVSISTVKLVKVVGGAGDLNVCRWASSGSVVCHFFSWFTNVLQRGNAFWHQPARHSFMAALATPHMGLMGKPLVGGLEGGTQPMWQANPVPGRLADWRYAAGL